MVQSGSADREDSSNKRRILIVEDEAIVSMDLEFQLGSLGYDVVGIASNGEDAISFCTASPPDLILMDIVLEGPMDGVEVAAEILSTMDVPVIFLTAMADSQTLEKVKATAPFGYIIKPFDTRDLHSSIEIALTKHQMEKRLKESEQYFRALVKNSSDVFMVLDESASIRYCSQSVKRVLGFDPEHVLGLQLLQLVHPLDRNEAARLFRDLNDGREESVALECRFLHDDGTQPVLEAVCQNFLSNPSINGYTLTARDVTARRGAEDEIRKARDLAEAGNRAKSRFLANMSHEFRTPLNGVIGMLNIALDSGMAPDLADYVETALKSAETLHQLLNNILAFAEMESGSATVRRVQFDLHELIEGLAGKFRHEAHAKGLALRLTIARSVPRKVKGDPDKLLKAVESLLNNSVKFTERGEVGVDVAEAKVVAGGASPAGLPRRCMIEFSVRDSGLGIALADQERIFDSFTQLDASFTRKQGGAGLGLSIAKHLVEAMGGVICVESSAGEGSVFRVVLGFELPDPPPTEPQDAHDRGHEKKVSLPFQHRILLVEDNEISRKMMLRLLESDGHEVETAVNGLEAIGKVKGPPFDIILMDIEMPVMDGLSTARELRKAGIVTPVVAMTAHDIRRARETCIGAGMNDCLAKPIRTPELFATIEKHARPGAKKSGGVSDAGASQVSVVAPSRADRINFRDSLSRVDGDRELMAEIWRDFLSVAPEQVAALRHDVEGRYWAIACRHAHSLKGASATIGAERLAEIASSLEDAAKVGDAGEAEKNIKFIEDEFNLLAVELKKGVDNV